MGSIRGTDLKRALEAMGFTFETASGGGSHFKIKRDGHRTVPISLHGGLRDEIDDKILKKMARQLELDDWTVLKKY